LTEVKKEATGDKTVLRMSLDAKATIKIGEFSRKGKTRVTIKALDHDFKPDSHTTPFGILLPDYDRLYLYFSQGRITSDFIVDCLNDCWQQVKIDYPDVQTLLLYQDNGPENHSRRTQFMHRITQLADQIQRTIRLAYYPPYHSKYNPIERVWGALEQHWNGTLLDHIDTVLQFAKTMTWKQGSPVITLVEKIYETGKKLNQKAMSLLEKRFERETGLEKWFVTIRSLPTQST
jgi:hypothetical protein